MSGYCALLLPRYGVWQGFYVEQLDMTEGLITAVRTNLDTIPYHPNNCVTLDDSCTVPDCDLGCLSILASLLVHDALTCDLAGIGVTADAISRLLGEAYFWIEGSMDGEVITTTLGQLPGRSLEAARQSAAVLGELALHGA